MNYSLREVEYIPEKLDENIMYYSRRFQLIDFLCPCGEGHRSGIRVGPRWDTGWEIFINSSNDFTITPSILNNICGAHFFVNSGQIDWCE